MKKNLKNKFKMGNKAIAFLILLFLFIFPVFAENNIGGETDEYGCVIPAGYSWCEPREKCLRTWEEICPKTLEDYKNLTNQQENYIKDLNTTIERKDFGISVVNNNINSCQKERIKMRNYFLISTSVLIIMLVVMLIKGLRRKNVPNAH